MSENILPGVVKTVTKEIKDILSSDLEGIRLVVNEKDITDIQADIDGPVNTPYESGVFRVRLRLCNAYPVEPPRGYFLTKIFHPNIMPSTGEICVNTMKRDWRPDMGIKHLLITVRCLLIIPNPESALNEEAGRLLLEQYDEFFQRAKLFTEIHAHGNKHSLSVNVYSAVKTYEEGATVNGVLTAATTSSTSPVLRDSSNDKAEGDSRPSSSAGTSVPSAHSPHTHNSNAATKKHQMQAKKALKRL